MKRLLVVFILPIMVCLSCKNDPTQLSTAEFKELMDNIARGWSDQDTDLALSSFDEDVIYMEPPDIQYYRGHEQLRPYFDALEPRHKMVFHNLWFDENSQTGAGEYTFSYGKDTADTGIVVVELKNGKIVFWREYQRKGPVDFKKFLSTDLKKWQWHIGNYPEPNPSKNESPQ